MYQPHWFLQPRKEEVEELCPEQRWTSMVVAHPEKFMCIFPTCAKQIQQDSRHAQRRETMMHHYLESLPPLQKTFCRLSKTVGKIHPLPNSDEISRNMKNPSCATASHYMSFSPDECLAFLNHLMKRGETQQSQRKRRKQHTDTHQHTNTQTTNNKQKTKNNKNPIRCVA